MKSKLALALAVLGILSLAGTAQAVPVVANTWYEFAFTDTATLATGCAPADPAGPLCTPSSGTATTFVGEAPWTFTAGSGGATLVVQDAFLIGDEFFVFDFGVLLGATFAVADTGACGDDPVPCIGFASGGLFFLGAGDHSINILPADSPFGGGAAYFQIVADVVPEPGTMLLLGAGLVGLGVVRRRR